MAPEPTLSQQPGTMLLSTCSFCAAPLHAWNTKDCERCETRYCDALCQRQHWRAKDGAHEKLCKKIERGGGAEQHHAKRRCAIADAIAVRSCVADTAGEICYICRTDGKKEGLVRGCACRGTMGAAHLSCLAQQARLANENDPAHTGPLEDYSSRWGRWHTCGLCEQSYHGVVACALGWRCWLTYVMLPRTDVRRYFAMETLGSALIEGRRGKEALPLLQTSLTECRFYTPPDSEAYPLMMRHNRQCIARCYNELGQHHKALKIQRDLFENQLELSGSSGAIAFSSAACLAYTLVALGKYAEARDLAVRWQPEARKIIRYEGNDIELQLSFANATWKDPDILSPEARFNATKFLDLAYKQSRRVLGPLHPKTRRVRESFKECTLAFPQFTYTPIESPSLLEDIKNLS